MYEGVLGTRLVSMKGGTGWPGTVITRDCELPRGGLELSPGYLLEQPGSSYLLEAYAILSLD